MKPFNVNQPEHLIVNQVIEEIEAYLFRNDMKVEFGSEGYAIIEELVIAYQYELSKMYDKNGQLDLEIQQLKKQLGL